jgi:hypothetical protein
MGLSLLLRIQAMALAEVLGDGESMLYQQSHDVL